MNKQLVRIKQRGKPDMYQEVGARNAELVAAWEPVVRAAIGWHDTRELPGEVGYRAAVLAQNKLARTIDALPPEHRP